MFDATLTRDIVLPECIFGTLIAKGELYYTLERPWMENAHNVSCIPLGAYECELIDRVTINGIQKVYSVKNVPNRFAILIHPGNYVRDSLGCILIALGRDVDKKMLINSRQGLTNFIKLMGDRFTLNIN